MFKQAESCHRRCRRKDSGRWLERNPQPMGSPALGGAPSIQTPQPLAAPALGAGVFPEICPLSLKNSPLKLLLAEPAGSRPLERDCKTCRKLRADEISRHITLNPPPWCSLSAAASPHLAPGHCHRVLPEGDSPAPSRHAGHSPDTRPPDIPWGWRPRFCLDFKLAQVGRARSCFKPSQGSPHGT